MRRLRNPVRGDRLCPPEKCGPGLVNPHNGKVIPFETYAFWAERRMSLVDSLPQSLRESIHEHGTNKKMLDTIREGKKGYLRKVADMLNRAHAYETADQVRIREENARKRALADINV